MNELDNFADKFLEKYDYILKEKKNSKYQDLKNSDDTSSDILKKLMHLYRSHNADRIKKIYKNLESKNIFSKSVTNLIKENTKLSNSLGSSINNFEHIPPHIPENPIHKTNVHLDKISNELNKTVSLVKNMNELGLQMVAEAAESSTKINKNNTTMIVIGLITLIVSFFMSLASFYSSYQSSTKIEKFISNLSIEYQTFETNKIKHNQLLIETLISNQKVLITNLKEKNEQLHSKLNEVLRDTKKNNNELRRLNSKIDDEHKKDINKKV